MITLQNSQLKVLIHPRGAELQSLFSLQNGIEYMWNGDAAYWPKYSPVLFPIVGPLKGGTYFFNEHSYELPRHGFAREKIFEARQESDQAVLFVLQQDAESLAVFPFWFRLGLRYRLEGATLYCTYEVENTGNTDLWFSVGGHPAFAVPLVSDTDYTDYYLKFNVEEPLLRWKLMDGLVSDETEEVKLVDGKLMLHPSLFYEDAIVFKHLQSTSVSLLCDKHSHGLQFNFEGFPHLGIWAAKDAPFVCIEPWCGHGDTVDHNQELERKEGIVLLPPGTKWQRTWSVNCF